MKRRKQGTPPRIICDEVACATLGTPCHVYRFSRDAYGYGRISFGGRWVKLHRFMWEKEIGSIPANLVIDHVCQNKACCNVEHLRLVTQSVNAVENCVSTGAERMRAKTHCPHGHAYDERNTYRTKRGGRYCRACRRKAVAAWKITRKAAGLPI